MSDIQKNESFTEFYNRKLVPTLFKLEKERKIISTKLAITFFAFLIPFLFILYVIDVFGIYDWLLYFVYWPRPLPESQFAITLLDLSPVTAFVSLLFFIYYSNKYYLFFKKVKAEIFTKFLGFYPKFEYFTGKNENMDFFKDSRLFPFFNSLVIDDKVSGKINNINFQIIDAFMGTYIIPTNGPLEENSNSYYPTSSLFFLLLQVLILLMITTPIFSAFRGILLIADFEKEADFETREHTVLFEKTSLNKINSSLNFLNENYHKITLESTDFEKKYLAYSTDEVGGRYILTPSLIERILGIKTNFKAKYFRMSFKDQKMLLAISTNRNMLNFFPNAFASFLNKNNFEVVHKDLDFLIALLEYFKLRNKVTP